MNSICRLSQLKQLEAESIHIFRDAISQFENPVLLYSIGKDSSVLVHLARKAFYPGRLPFKLLHIDSTFKFREMIEFRDRFVQENDLDLIVHSNQEGIAAGVNPFTYGSRKYTDIMKTQALIQALTAGKYDAVFGGARRDEEKSRAKERIFSFRDKFNQWDPKINDRNYGTFTTAVSIREKASVSFLCPTGRNWISGNISAWKNTGGGPVFR